MLSLLCCDAVSSQGAASALAGWVPVSVRVTPGISRHVGISAS